MQIILRTFGLPRQVIESDWLEIELPENTTLTDLNERLDLEFPQLFGLRSLLMSVNGEKVSQDYKLCDGDQVFLIPVVAGG